MLELDLEVLSTHFERTESVAVILSLVRAGLEFSKSHLLQ
jgi:hypothetical protein